MYVGMISTTWKNQGQRRVSQKIAYKREVFPKRRTARRASEPEGHNISTLTYVGIDTPKSKQNGDVSNMNHQIDLAANENATSQKKPFSFPLKYLQER